MEKTKWQIKNGQSRDIGIIGHTRHRTTQAQHKTHDPFYMNLKQSQHWKKSIVEVKFHGANSLKQQSVRRNVAPLGHIIPISGQPQLCAVFFMRNKNHYFFQIWLTLFVEKKTVILFSSLRIINVFLKKNNNRIKIKLSITCDGFGGLLLGFPIYSIKQNLILHDQQPNTFVLESSVDFISIQMY